MLVGLVCSLIFVASRHSRSRVGHGRLIGWIPSLKKDCRTRRFSFSPGQCPPRWPTVAGRRALLEGDRP